MRWTFYTTSGQIKVVGTTGATGATGTQGIPGPGLLAPIEGDDHDQSNALFIAPSITKSLPLDHHADLTNFTANDDHTQYTKIAGRTGTTNDTTLSTSADGTLYGSTTTTKNAIIRPNSADQTTGAVIVQQDSQNRIVGGTVKNIIVSSSQTNPTAETRVTTYTMGGAPSAGRVFRLRISCSATFGGGATLTYRIRMGQDTTAATGTVLVTVVGGLAPAAFDMELYMVVRTAGAGGVVWDDGWRNVAGFSSVGQVTNSVDLSGTPVIKSTAIFSLSNGSNVISDDIFLVEELN